jgi:hypothetical protein
MLTYEIEANQYGMRVYDTDRSDMAYVASCVIQTYGRTGWMRQITSPLLVKTVVENLEDLLINLKIDCFEGSMNPAMARVVRAAARGKARFDMLQVTEYAGRKLQWCRLSRSENV